MKYSSIPLILIVSGFLQSCHKEPPVPATTSRLIPAELKAYWNFKPGSYWIYKDSVSGDIDSLYVIGYQNGTGRGILNYTQDSIIYEYLELDTHSSLDGFDYDYSINTQAAFKGIQDGNQVFEASSKPGTDTHDCFIYPLNKGFQTGQGYGGIVDTCIIRNIFSNYNSYTNVIEVDNTYDSFENYLPTKSLYAKGIGRVRYQVPYYNKVRTLIRYHLN